jgi:hypothetical protein
MPLTIGTRLGPYEIVSLLGAGGMGQVYRARDAKLNRDVALKILPDAFANDPDRLARFTREAQTLASLSHPHIGHIYGFEDSGATHALVMELVEGEDLAQRLVRGAIPVPEALAIAKQIAEALEAAHRGSCTATSSPSTSRFVPTFCQGSRLRPCEGGGSHASSPGMAASRFADDHRPGDDDRVGVILGTAALCRRNRRAEDRWTSARTSWAFGCVLYEMLTGRAVFEGATVRSWRASSNASPTELRCRQPPPGVRRALQKCLEKDLKRRLRDINDLGCCRTRAGIEFAEEAQRAGARIYPQSATQQLQVFFALSDTFLFDEMPAFRDSLTLPPPDRAQRLRHASVRDEMRAQWADTTGRHIVFGGVGSDGVTRLWLRSLDALETRPLTGVNADAGQIPPVFWSPDSRFLAFDNRGRLMKLDMSGGQPHIPSRFPAAAVHTSPRIAGSTARRGHRVRPERS